MAIIVVCECDAAYEQIEIAIEDRVEDSVDCRAAAMNSNHGTAIKCSRLTS